VISDSFLCLLDAVAKVRASFRHGMTTDSSMTESPLTAVGDMSGNYFRGDYNITFLCDSCRSERLASEMAVPIAMRILPDH